MNMDPLSIVLTIVGTVLALVFVAVGVQTILVLQEIKRTLQRINMFTEVVEHTVTRTFAPLQQMGGMVQGMKAGMKLLETFGTFLQKNHDR